MKRIFLVASLYLATLQGHTQITELLFENFNSGFPVGWQRVNQDGLTPAVPVSYVNNAWVMIENFDSTGTGDSVLVATSYYSPAGTASDWLILPPVTLTSHGNTLAWQVKSVDPSYPDGYQVLVNTSAGVTDSFDIASPVFYTDAELPDWTDRSIVLDSFAGQTVYIAFRLKSSDKFLLMLDDIHLFADSTLGTQTIEAEIPVGRFYPNPASDFIMAEYFLSEPGMISLLDLSGRVLAKQSLNRGMNRLGCETYARGMYLVRIETETRAVTQRIMLR